MDAPAIPPMIGPYRIERTLGRGGMAEVFLAWRGDEPAQRVFALKRMLAHELTNPHAEELFSHETRLLSQLHHSNIVRALDHGVDAGRPYLVLEYVDGLSLKELQRRLQLPLSLATFVISEVCRGLAYCHEFKHEGRAHDLVHRDVKPENILIARDGSVKLADFGIASWSDRESFTATNQCRGTPWYMSPEHMGEAALDARSDLFSLGVVLYELLVGEHPFRDAARSSVAHAIRAILYEGHFIPLDQRVPLLEPELVELGHRLLAREPSERPQSAREVLAILNRLPSRNSARDLLAAYVVRALDEKPLADAHDAAASTPRSSKHLVSVTPPSLCDFPSDLLDGEEDGESREVVLPPAASESGTRGLDGHAEAAHTTPPPPGGARRWSLAAIVVLATLATAAALFATRPSPFTAGSVSAATATPRPSAAPSQPVTASVPYSVVPASLPASPLAIEQAADPSHTPTPTIPEHGAASAGPARSASQIPTPALAAPSASLHIVIYQWGYVWLDGTFKGESPVDVSGLPPGPHSIGYGQDPTGPTKTTRVRLRPGANTKEYDLAPRDSRNSQ